MDTQRPSPDRSLETLRGHLIAAQLRLEACSGPDFRGDETIERLDAEIARLRREIQKLVDAGWVR